MTRGVVCIVALLILFAAVTPCFALCSDQKTKKGVNTPPPNQNANLGGLKELGFTTPRLQSGASRASGYPPERSENGRKPEPTIMTKGLMKMAENRRRSETLTVRLTKAEKAALIAKSKKAKMTLTEYVLAVSRDTKIVLPPDTAPIILELKRIGNNLNQIAARVNSGMAYVPDLTDVMENQNKIYGLLLNLTEECQWQR